MSRKGEEEVVENQEEPRITVVTEQQLVIAKLDAILMLLQEKNN